jgi:hypothetical protein
VAVNRCDAWIHPGVAGSSAFSTPGFHAPQEAARILGDSIDFSRRGQNVLRPPPGAGG